MYSLSPQAIHRCASDIGQRHGERACALVEQQIIWSRERGADVEADFWTGVFGQLSDGAHGLLMSPLSDPVIGHRPAPAQGVAEDTKETAMSRFRKVRGVPTEATRNPNLSTENQPDGAARRPSDTLDREPKRDPASGGSIPSDYNPASGTRIGEEGDTAAGRAREGQRSAGNALRD